MCNAKLIWNAAIHMMASLTSWCAIMMLNEIAERYDDDEGNNYYFYNKHNIHWSCFSQVLISSC